MDRTNAFKYFLGNFNKVCVIKKLYNNNSSSDEDATTDYLFKHFKRSKYRISAEIICFFVTQLWI